MSFCIQSETSTKLFLIYSNIYINPDKTEYSIFSRLKQHPGHTILKLNNKILKYNRNPKLLGVTLDEKLNFESFPLYCV
jgi:hypothetical protein